jgi:hypothetical protein
MDKERRQRIKRKNSQDFLEYLLQKPSFDDEFNPFGPKSEEIINRIQYRVAHPIPNTTTGPYLTRKGCLIRTSKVSLCTQFDDVAHV